MKQEQHIHHTEKPQYLQAQFNRWADAVLDVMASSPPVPTPGCLSHHVTAGSTGEHFASSCITPSRGTITQYTRNHNCTACRPHTMVQGGIIMNSYRIRWASPLGVCLVLAIAFGLYSFLVALLIAL